MSTQNMSINYPRHLSTLSTEDKNYIERTLHNYIFPDDLSGYVFWIAFQVYEIVQSIIDRSEWKKAELKIKNHYLNEHKDSRYQMIVWQEIDASTAKNAQNFLKTTLETMNRDKPDFINLLKKKFQPIMGSCSLE